MVCLYALGLRPYFCLKAVAKYSAWLNPLSKATSVIENNGSIVGREVYLKTWATDYQNSGLESFTYTDEFIRIFGNVALVRSKSVFTKKQDGKLVTGYSVYTDTYVKEQGRWWCVQAQMTPVRP